MVACWSVEWTALLILWPMPVSQRGGGATPQGAAGGREYRAFAAGYTTVAHAATPAGMSVAFIIGPRLTGETVWKVVK